MNSSWLERCVALAAIVVALAFAPHAQARETAKFKVLSISGARRALARSW
jgi:hypothetical protein